MYQIPAPKNTKPFAFCTSKGDKGWLKSLNSFAIVELEQFDNMANAGDYKGMINILTKDDKIRKILRKLSFEEMQNLFEAYFKSYKLDAKK